MSFLIYSIKTISLYMILLLYYKSKNSSLFEFHLAIVDIDIIDIIDGALEPCESSRDDYIVASYTRTTYMNCVTILEIILRIASSFITSNRNLIN